MSVGNFRNPQVLSLFSDKAFPKEDVSLLPKGKTKSEEKKLVETFNSFFSNIVKNLQVQN